MYSALLLLPGRQGTLWTGTLVRNKFGLSRILEEIASFLMGQEGLPGFRSPSRKRAPRRAGRGERSWGGSPYLLLSAAHSLFSSIPEKGASASGRAAPVTSSDLEGQWGPSHAPSWSGETAVQV